MINQAIERFWPRVSLSPGRLQQHLPALDGVRGMAIFIVLCYDCLKIPQDGSAVTLLIRKFASVGWIGVDLFFVLSGFLITGILLETAGRKGYWKSFILRRSVRIFPLYYFTLLSIFLLAPLFLGPNSDSSLAANLRKVGQDQFWYWTYLQNWLLAWRASWPEERVLNHFWSLAIEEQFYLIWPLFVVLLGRRSLAWFAGIMCILALVLRLVILHEGGSVVSTYTMTITRMDSLFAGALLAMFLRSKWQSNRLVQLFPLLFLMAFAGIAGLELAMNFLKSQSWSACSYGHTLVGVLFVCLIAAAAVVPDRHLISRLFRFPGLIWLGKYSYAIYVFHRFIYAGVKQFSWEFLSPTLAGWAIFLLTFMGSCLVAKISWIFLERPFLSLKKYMPRPDQQANEVVNASTTSNHEPCLTPAGVPAP